MFVLNFSMLFNHCYQDSRDHDENSYDDSKVLCWQICRIWSTDWFLNAEVETRKLVAHVQQLTGATQSTTGC